MANIYIMKRVFSLVIIIFSFIKTNAQRGQVHGSEWDDGESTPIGDFLRIILVIGAIVWGIQSYTNYRKDKEK